MNPTHQEIEDFRNGKIKFLQVGPTNEIGEPVELSKPSIPLPDKIEPEKFYASNGSNLDEMVEITKRLSPEAKKINEILDYLNSLEKK